MSNKERVLGTEFENRRKKIKKDKKHFLSLDNKEMDESLVEEKLNFRAEKVDTPVQSEELPSLPFGNLS